MHRRQHFLSNNNSRCIYLHVYSTAGRCYLTDVAWQNAKAIRSHVKPLSLLTAAAASQFDVPPRCTRCFFVIIFVLVFLRAFVLRQTCALGQRRPNAGHLAHIPVKSRRLIVAFASWLTYILVLTMARGYLSFHTKNRYLHHNPVWLRTSLVRISKSNAVNFCYYFLYLLY